MLPPTLGESLLFNVRKNISALREKYFYSCEKYFHFREEYFHFCEEYFLWKRNKLLSSKKRAFSLSVGTSVRWRAFAFSPSVTTNVRWRSTLQCPEKYFRFARKVFPLLWEIFFTIVKNIFTFVKNIFSKREISSWTQRRGPSRWVLALVLWRALDLLLPHWMIPRDRRRLLSQVLAHMNDHN